MSKHLIIAYLFFCCMVSVEAGEIAGVTVPDEVTVGAHSLTLNGAGIRSKFFIKVYVGALYLSQRTADSATILHGTGPAAVHMYIVHGEIDRKKLVAAWREGFESNLDATELTALAERMTRFYELFPTVHKGDIIKLDYDPVTGTSIIINDKLQGTINGESFMQAWLRIWLGEKPADVDLKAGMLGLE